MNLNVKLKKLKKGKGTFEKLKKQKAKKPQNSLDHLSIRRGRLEREKTVWKSSLMWQLSRAEHSRTFLNCLLMLIDCDVDILV